MSYLIDFSKFNIGYVAYCGMLDEYQNVTKLDISTFNTSSVTHMYGMFRGCSSLGSMIYLHLIQVVLLICIVCFVDVVV